MNRFAWLAILALVLASSFRGQSEPASVPNSAPNALGLPNRTAIIAKLVSGLDTAQCKPGDTVDAQITHDVKQGSRTIIKKGALVIGRISKTQTVPDVNGLYGIWVVFDSVAIKPGEPASLPLDIQAIAPPPSGGADNLNGTDSVAVWGGHGSAREGFVDELTSKSTGSISLPGVDVAFQPLNGVHTTLVVSKKSNFRLPKNSQIVFRVFAP
jgi:hypothetical protein